MVISRASAKAWKLMRIELNVLGFEVLSLLFTLLAFILKCTWGLSPKCRANVLQHVEFRRENSVINTIDEAQRSKAIHHARGAVPQFHTDFAPLCSTVRCQLFGVLRAV